MYPSTTSFPLRLGVRPRASVIVPAGNSEYALTYSGTQTNSVSAASYTFPAYDIGSVNGYKFAIVGISYNANINRLVSSLSIGPNNNPTLVRSDTDTNFLIKTHIYRAALPASATADVTVTFGGNVDLGIQCSVWHAGRINQVPLTSRGGANSASAANTITGVSVATGGFLIGVGGSSSSTAFEPWVWSGVDTLTERADTKLAAGHNYSTYDVLTTETTTRDLTGDITGGNRWCHSLASWT